MNESIIEIIETLEMLSEDLPLKAKIQLDTVVDELKKVDMLDLDVNGLMKIQDDLEMISNTSNIDSFTRNEIINAVAVIEGIYNS